MEPGRGEHGMEEEEGDPQVPPLPTENEPPLERQLETPKRPRRLIAFEER
jgi:hypothetical protein